jgi:hypothetical protein
MRIAVLVGAVLLVGCGSAEPRLARIDAQPVIGLTRRIAHEGACAQARDIAAVQRRALGLINQGRVPAKLQEPFLSGVNALGEQKPACVPGEGRGKPAAARQATKLRAWLEKYSG